MISTSPFSRRVLAVAALVGLNAAFCGAPVHAQDQQADIDALRGQIADLQKRLDALDAAQKETDKTIKNAKPVVSTKTPIKISGLLQVHTLDYFNQGGTSNSRRADTFRLRRGELRITAPQITDKVSATLMIDPAKDTTSNLARNNILQEIVLSYQINKNAQNSNSVDLGQFKISVGYESLVSSAALPFIERPLIFTSRDPFRRRLRRRARHRRAVELDISRFRCESRRFQRHRRPPERPRAVRQQSVFGTFGL